MGARRSKRFTHCNETLAPNHPPPPSHTQHSFRTLISAIQSPEGLKPTLLKKLYYLLLDMSLNDEAMQWSNCEAASDYLSMELNKCGFKVKFRDMRNLSDVLFKLLDKRFKRFLSALRDVSMCKSELCVVDMWGSVDELALILRCCMVILTLLELDQNLLLEKGRVLVVVLKIVISLGSSGENEKGCLGFEKLFSCERAFSSDGDCTTSVVAEDFVASLRFLEPTDPCRPFICTVLEVFADELLMHRSLRKYFMLIDSASSTSKVLFTCQLSHGDVGTVLEVISAHFVLSVSDEQAFYNFINRLVWQYSKDFRCPELGLTPSISLLLNPIILSAPKMFQAHLISLVAEAIGIGTSSKNLRQDFRLMNYYLTAFERSVILYTGHMSSFQMDGHPIGFKGSVNSSTLGKSQPTFDSYIQQVTRNKIHNAVSKSDDLWDSYLCNAFLGTESDLVAGSISYMKESQHVFDESCRDEILLILDCIILRAFSDVKSDTELYRKGDTSAEDIYLLASILKLMSSSLFQAIWCLRHSRNLGCLKSLKNGSLCKEYDFMLGIIGCFQHFNVSLPVQMFLCDMMQTHPRHKESKWMLLHFSGLLSLSFDSGLDFLVKGCISTMMALMNLFAFEEGDLVALTSLLGARLEAFPSKLSYDEVGEARVHKKSSNKVASKFQKIQMLYLRKDSHTSFLQITQGEQAETSENASILTCMKESCDGIEEETVETCNGKIFLNCILEEGSQKSSDCDDLADFIECKRGKDYSGWLKDRNRFHKWRSQKIAVLKWKKKKKVWKLTGNKT